MKIWILRGILFVGELFEREGGEGARMSRCADGEAGWVVAVAWW